MLGSLFVFSARSFKYTPRIVAYYPVKGGPKMLTIPFGVYLREKFSESKNPSLDRENMATRLREFRELTTQKRNKYVRIAKSNLKIVTARKEIFNLMTINAYNLYAKIRLPKSIESQSGKHVDRLAGAVKIVAKEWNALKDSTKKKYYTQAAALRQLARKKRNKMLTKYFGRKFSE